MHPTVPIQPIYITCENVGTFEIVSILQHIVDSDTSFCTVHLNTLYSYKCEWRVGSSVCSVCVVASISSFITLENGLKLGPDASTIPGRG